MGFMEKIFGTHSERELKLINKTIDKIESLRPEMQKLSDAELREKTTEFKKRLAEGETLDDILRLCVRRVSVCLVWNITEYSSSVV